MNNVPSRRDVLKVLAGASAGFALGACRRRVTAGSEPVVLYTSADAFLVQQVTAAFTTLSGVEVRAVTDSEATKTTGLVGRLMAERSSPRAEVWWSSEVMGTVGLARAGLMTPSAPASLAEFSGSWPGGLCDSQGLWWGFGQRARAVVYSTSRIKDRDIPSSLEALAAFTPSGRVGIAQPQFGTTRTHMAWVVSLLGDEKARGLFRRLRDNCRLYPGNSAVVRAVAQGECDVGLTDTDDVWAGLSNGWALGHSFGVGPADGQALLIPNTVALLSRGAVRKEARALVDFLCSVECERLLAMSESRNIPIRDDVRAEVGKSVKEVAVPQGAGSVDWTRVGDELERADRLISEAFPV